MSITLRKHKRRAAAGMACRFLEGWHWVGARIGWKRTINGRWLKWWG